MTEQLAILFDRAERYLTTVLDERGWAVTRPPDVEPAPSGALSSERA